MAGHPGINAFVYGDTVGPDTRNGRRRQIAYMSLKGEELFDLIVNGPITLDDLTSMQRITRPNGQIAFQTSKVSFIYPRGGPIFAQLILCGSITTHHFHHMKMVIINGVFCLKIPNVVFHPPWSEDKGIALTVIVSQECLGVMPDGTPYEYATMTKRHKVVPDTKTWWLRLRDWFGTKFDQARYAFS